jgi:transmembrane sensor
VSASAGYSETQRREAAEWFIVINGEDDPNPETLQAWLQWMEADAGNQRAFEAIAQAWHSTPRSSGAAALPTEAEILADDYDPEESVADWMAGRKTARASRAPAGDLAARRRATRVRWWTLAAASLAALSIGGVEMARYLRGAQNDEFATRTGEQIEITLADGSKVWLGPESKLRVSFSAARRNLELARGEAYFSVRKDKSRPFVVHSEGGDITAVGTAFNVRDVDRDVTVAVSEGIVTVAPPEQAVVSAPETVRVASGQQITFNAEASPTSLAIKASAAPGERARWRDGILVYRDEPLRSVIKDIARYRAEPLEIRDPRVGDLRFSGVIYTKALDEWLAALPESFPVRIVSGDQRQEILSR